MVRKSGIQAGHAQILIDQQHGIELEDPGKVTTAKTRGLAGSGLAAAGH
jgi:hypothetical protein